MSSANFDTLIPDRVYSGSFPFLSPFSKEKKRGRWPGVSTAKFLRVPYVSGLATIPYL